MENTLQTLAEHYQKTYEVTYEFWKERNNTFLALLGVIGVGALLSFGTQDTNSLIVYAIAKFLGVTDVVYIESLQKSFPFALLQSILLIVVFYLMVNLYHRTVTVLRNYCYLADVECEIRQNLQLSYLQYSFTREGSYYWSNRRSLMGAVKWIYILLLGFLLLAFLGGRIYGDFVQQNILLTIIDIILVSPTILFFIGYAFVSISKDQPKASAKQLPLAEKDHISLSGAIPKS